MGDLNVFEIKTTAQRQEMLRHVLNDIKAFDYMLRKGMFESGISRIGAEQEFCIANHTFRPANKALALLKDLNDEHFTTELAKFNLEINLDPQTFENHALRKLADQLTRLLTQGRNVAEHHEAKILLAGIVPTIMRDHLELDNLTPLPRYETPKTVDTQISFLKKVTTCLGMSADETVNAKGTRYHIVYRLPLKKQDVFSMLPGFKNFDPVAHHQTLAECNGKPVVAKHAGYIFMPLYQEQGQDGFFIVQKDKG